MRICDHNIIKQLWCATLQTILITHVHTRLLLTHNECLCVHQPVEMMKATLFSCTGYLTEGVGGEKQSVTLCLLSTASANRHRRTPISPRSELTLPRSPLTHLLLSGCTCWSSTPALICTREPTLTPVFFPKYVTACALERQSNFHQYENVKGCCSCTPTHTHTQTHN